MAADTDRIYEKLDSIAGDITAIKIHLAELNGRANRTATEVDEHLADHSTRQRDIAARVAQLLIAVMAGVSISGLVVWLGLGG